MYSSTEFLREFVGLLQVLAALFAFVGLCRIVVGSVEHLRDIYIMTCRPS